MILGGLIGLTFPAPAQVHVQAHLGKHVAVGLQLGPHVETCAPTGYWREVTERVWVEGPCRQVYHAPVYGWRRDHCGHRHWTIVRAGWTETIRSPGHYEYRTRRVWVTHHHHDGGRGRRW